VEPPAEYENLRVEAVSRITLRDPDNRTDELLGARLSMS
jgi:hypothetical protein